MTETMVLELLRAMLPGLARLAVVWDPGTPSHRPALAAVEDGGRRLGLRIQPLAVHGTAELDDAFSAMVQERAGAVLVLSTPLFMGAAGRLAELAIAHKLPSMYGPREHVEAGGLLSRRRSSSSLST